MIEGQQLTYPNKSKSQIDNQYRYAGNLIEDRLKSGKFNSMNEVLKDIEKSKPYSDYQAAKKVAGRAAYMGLIPKGSSNEGGITSEQLAAAGRLSEQMNAPKKSSVEGFVGAKPLHNQVVKMGKETEFSLNEQYTMSQKLLSKASSKYGEDMASKRQDVSKEELKSVTNWLDNVLRNPNTSTLGDAISQLASRNPESAKVAEGIVSEMFKDPKLADRVSVDPLTKKLTPKDIKNCNLYCEGLAKSLGIKEANSRSSKLSKSEVLNKYYSIGSLIQFKMNSGKYSTYHDLLKDISSDMDKNSKRVATEIVNELGVRSVRYNGK